MSNAMADSNKASSPDFVKKLFQMLSEHEYDHIVRWAPQGDSFLVMDTNEFTKVILPRHFKHSNFASFVRQLNKYDFHKVRQADQALEGNPHGEGTWEFKHPEFNIHNGDALDNIKRKAPAAKRVPKIEPGQPSQPSPVSNGASFYGGGGGDLQGLQRQFESMKAMQAGMNNHLQALTRNYQQVISEMLNFQRNIVAQDQVMQNLISYLMNNPNGGNNGGHADGLQGDPHAQKLVDEYSEVARQSYEQIEGMTRRASHLGLLPDQPVAPSWPQYDSAPAYPAYQNNYDASAAGAMHNQQNYNPYTQQMGQSMSHPNHSPGDYSPSNGSQTPNPNSYQSNQAYQQQQHSITQQRRVEDDQRQAQQQQQHQQQNQTHQHYLQNQQPNLQQHSQQIAQQHLSQQQHQSRMHTPREERPDPLQQRSGVTDRYPGNGMNADFSFNEQAASMIKAVKSGQGQITPWVTPPKILLVEDDAVCRRLSSKFLSFFGCDIDTATDGVSAVTQMNEKKYDLVLMDIVMPNLDGVSATSIIRKNDSTTPIISMTSNVESGDVMTYFSHGMNDILPKPFTKDGLLGMLEKHLIHLKTLKQQGLNGTERVIPSLGDVSGDGRELEIGMTEAEYLGMLSGLSGGLPMGNLRDHGLDQQLSASTGSSNKRMKLDDMT